MCKAPYTAETISEWFLAYNETKVDESGADRISNLKLQKLLYYAQGCYLALTGHALFDDPIKAWKHGPVVENIYHKYKHFKDDGINMSSDFNFSSINKETTNILEEVYEVFGQYSAWKLRELTHSEYPWKDTPQSETITLDKIKNYFTENYVED